ncbi:MAG TPA: hypothetical protein VKQ71_01595 [Acidimicrobiales bacterium]|nr:hypothetical protein [Acidimicrobiales bacterium]
MATETAPSSASFSVTLEGLDDALAQIPNVDRRNQLMRYAVTKIAAKVQSLAMHRIAVRTGTTRRTIRMTVEGAGAGIAARVGILEATAQSRVGLYLEKGTGIYGPKGQRIYPTHARALRWPVGAKGEVRLTGTHTSAHARSGKAEFAFARSIRGMRAQPFLQPAIDEAQATYWPEVLREVRELAFGTAGMPGVGPAEVA